MRFKPTLRLLWGAKYGLMWFFFHRKDGGGMQGIRIEKKLKKLALPETNTVHVQHQHFVNQLTVEIHATASRICRWIFQSGICSLWTSDLMRDFFRRLYHLLEKKIYKMSRSQIPLNPKGSLPFFLAWAWWFRLFFGPVLLESWLPNPSKNNLKKHGCVSKYKYEPHHQCRNPDRFTRAPDTATGSVGACTQNSRTSTRVERWPVKLPSKSPLLALLKTFFLVESSKDFLEFMKWQKKHLIQNI